MQVTYYPINEDTARNAHYMVHMSDYKPGSATASYRAAMKQNGFRWSPRYGAWQRQLTQNAESAARRALGLK